MPPPRLRPRWACVFLLLAFLAGLSFFGSRLLRVDADILSALPHRDPLLAEAREVIRHLPIQDRLVIDLGGGGQQRAVLFAAAQHVTDRLRESALFREVGLDAIAGQFPALVEHLLAHLPMLFDAGDLERQVAPLLSPEQIRHALAEHLRRLHGMEGIGQSRWITRDPLNLHRLAMARLGEMLPGKDARFENGQLVSPDGRHILIVAALARSATDTRTAREIVLLLEDIRRDLAVRFGAAAPTLQPMGAYRAALDNEETAKKDMRLAVAVTTVGIALLLVLAFPRPWLGLLALLPSALGAVLALWASSLCLGALSLVTIGFGSAIMAFTVDLGITYLLFLDRPERMSGQAVRREVGAAEFLAAFTTIGAFLLLFLSDFKILAEIGLFSSLGVFFAFLLVHYGFPRIFPSLPPAKREGASLFRRGADSLFLRGGTAKFFAVLAAGLLLACWARPDFRIDLNALNAVSAETLQAEAEIQERWGNVPGRLHILLEGATVAEIQDKSDGLQQRIAAEQAAGRVQGAFVPSLLFPGEAQAQRRLEAWRGFWTNERQAALRRRIASAGEELGFARGAFRPFLEALGRETAGPVAIPERLYPLIGIHWDAERSRWLHLSSLTPASADAAEPIYHALHVDPSVQVFAPTLFTQRLGEVLGDMFVEMAWITGIGLVVVVFLFFFDLSLTLVALAPVAFALLATLGSLRLLGRPLDIPSLMLWVVVMGMGIDYSIYYTCSYQRYQDAHHPEMGRIRLAIVLAAATTLIGFGVLSLARHPLLQSVGVTSLLGILFSFVGACGLLPVLLRRYFSADPPPPETAAPGPVGHRRRILSRYRRLGAYPHLFAFFKLRWDPLFSRLGDLVEGGGRILDVGSGYGIPASWLLERSPGASVFGVEPDQERGRIAALAWKARGEVVQGQAPDLPDLPGPFDTVLMIDMVHFLSDEALRETLQRVREVLAPGGKVVIRATVPRELPCPWRRRIEEVRLRLRGRPPVYRKGEALRRLLAGAGFAVSRYGPDPPNPEEYWFVGRRGCG